MKSCLENGDVHRFGRLLHRHWELKQQLSSQIAPQRFPALYQRCLDFGALGGKISDAGGGGFLAIYTEQNRAEIERYLDSEGCRRMKFAFDEGGVKIIHQDGCPNRNR